MITRYFNLFLNAGSASPLVISANQYDHGEQWVFTLYSQLGVKYEPSSGAIVGIKADNLGIINTGSVDSEGRVVINETKQMTAVAGRAIFELLIDGDTHGTANFYVEVESKPGDNADFSASDLSLIQEAINSIAIAGSGAPAVVTLASQMTDEGKVYLYAGSETGYTKGDWYYYNGSAWTDGGKYGGTVDPTLTMSGVAADAKAVGDELTELKSEISDLEEQINQGGLSEELKSALDDFIKYVAFKDDNPLGQVYIDAVHDALYPPTNLSYITAVYTQSGTVYNADSLDSLKSDLVVTAHYSDSTSRVITSYALSGTLTVGTSTITVSYSGKTATFNVTVTNYWTYEWDYTQGKLEEQTGWNTDTSGTTSSTMISDGQKLTANGNSFYQILPQSGQAIKTMSDGYGTIEVECYGVWSTGTTAQNLRISAVKDTTNRLSVYVNGNKWRLLYNATPSSSENTVIADAVDNTLYKVRIVLKGTVADVYINDAKVATNVSATSNATASNSIMQVNATSDSYYSVVKSLKIRVGA